MKSAKQMYDTMTNAPRRPSRGHVTEKMDMASKMFGGESKKMAKGGCACRGDGIAQRGKTRGRMV